MILDSFLVRNFRILREAHLALDRGVHLFLGLNAQGKTSLIEAILFLATSTSHRTHREEELIGWGEETAYLRGELTGENEKTTLECGLEKNRKIIKIDGSVIPRVGDLYGRMRTVLFAPEDLTIVGGSPQDRRRFLDMAIAQLEPDYIPLLHHYRKALRQRNGVLKRLQQSADSAVRRELAVWDQPFLEYASRVNFRRCETIRQLAPLLREFYDGLAEDGPFSVKLTFGEGMKESEIREALRQRLERSRAAEIERGSAQTGPHRDDLVFTMKEKNLSFYGSQGQKRTAALALRLAESRLGFERTGSRPLLLIDDVVHEMDNIRRARFWDLMDFSGQSIVTATDRDHLGPRLEPTFVFQVNHGEIRSD